MKRVYIVLTVFLVAVLTSPALFAKRAATYQSAGQGGTYPSAGQEETYPDLQQGLEDAGADFPVLTFAGKQYRIKQANVEKKTNQRWYYFSSPQDKNGEIVVYISEVNQIRAVKRELEAYRTGSLADGLSSIMYENKGGSDFYAGSVIHEFTDNNPYQYRAEHVYYDKGLWVSVRYSYLSRHNPSRATAPKGSNKTPEFMSVQDLFRYSLVLPQMNPLSLPSRDYAK